MASKILAGSVVFGNFDRTEFYCQDDVESTKTGRPRQKAIELGIHALLRDRVVQAYYHYTERGWITLHGLEAAEKMYTEYHNLGGNGTVTKLMEDLRELPVKDRVTVLKDKMSPTD